MLHLLSHPQRRGRLVVHGGAVALVVALVLAGCGGDPKGGSAADPQPGDGQGAAQGGSGATGDGVAQTADTVGLDPALAVPAPGPLTSRLESADVLVSADTTLSDETVRAIKGIRGVSSVLEVELAQVPVQGQVLNVMAVDPAAYRSWTRSSSAGLQGVWDRVAGGEVAVPPAFDRQLIDADGYLTLGSAAGSPTIHVGAYADQVPFVDAVVNSKWGAKLDMQPGSALLVSTGITAPSRVQKAIASIIAGQEVSVQGLDVVAQFGLDPDAYQQANVVGTIADAVGTYRYSVLSGGQVRPEASWVSSHISSDTVPILGTVTCNTKIFPQLKGALGEIQAKGLADKIHPSEYAGCYYPRFIAGSTRLSNHAFGLALDLNVPGNQRGTVGEMDRAVVAIFKRWGFAWGGDWGYTDPMHFEMAALVNPGG